MPRVSATITAFLSEKALSDSQKTSLQKLLGVFNFNNTGAITATAITTGGALTAGSVNCTGALSSISASITSALSAGSITCAGVLSTASATVTGNVTAATTTVSGLLTAGTVSVTGSLSAASAALTGALTAASATVGGIAVRPAVWKVMAGTITNSSTTVASALPELSFTPVSGKTYEVEVLLLASSNATTTGLQLTVATGAGTIYLAPPNSTLGIYAVGGTYAATTAPVAAATSNYTILLKGIFIASGATDLTFTVKSSAAAAVVVYPGTYARFTAIN